ncbi:RidA family protein [Pelagibacterium flavum]|uniref:RidA family protein n=1 Tax=Pelagibacterium flavum TaxID=2984530 RepID=A0ABY6IJX4_9HYPH|nr:RidA family protein [Pelagibacterium sp. YIM 151497]UYQ70907.1 RidA family protein [Pelagibacterium sp. YIM 151497]
MKHLNPGKRMSGAVIANGTLYISGQVADDVNASLEEQTRQVLAKIDHYLEGGGTSRSKLAMVNIFLPNIMDFEAMNAVYDAWVDQQAAPARATIEARLANPSLRVEISAIAVV